MNIAIVQARMGSTRLPGKMLRPLAGRPVIDHALGRLSQALAPGGPLHGVVLATSEGGDNDPLVRHVQERWPAVTVIRGPENDVLARFTEAIRHTGATAVVRATGDCPLINLEALAAMLVALTQSGADVVNYRPGYEYVDKGLEAVRASALQRAAADPDLRPQDREHVTSLLYRCPERYRVHYIDSAPALRRGDIRLTVDTAADLAFFEALAEGIGGALDRPELGEVVAFLDAHPELLRINATAGRKSTLHERARLGFRCDGGPALGLGHMVGSLRLAQLAARELGFGAEFVLRDDPASLALVKRAGFAAEVLPAAMAPEADVARLIVKARESDWSGVVVNFCKDDLDRYAPHWGRLKDAGIRLIFMDNPLPPSYRLGDLVINALPHPEYPGYDPAAHPACHDGLAYFLPGELPAPVERGARGRLCSNGGCFSNPMEGETPASRVLHRATGATPDDVSRVLVAMGGGDEGNATGLVLDALALAGYAGVVDVVLGAANPHAAAVRAQFARLGLRGEVNQGVADLPVRMAAADLGFSGLGLTTYEMALYGVPVLLITGNAFNAGVAAGFAARYGGAVDLGLREDLTPADVAHAFHTLAANPARRATMSTAHRTAVDGQGPERVKKVLEQVVKCGIA